MPLLVISIYSYTSARNQLLEQAYENMNHMNQQINNNISGQLENFHQISGMLYTNATLKAYLTQAYEKDIDFVEAYGYINDLFFGLMAANSNVDGITVYVLNDTIPTDGTFIKYLYDEKAAPAWVRELDRTYGNVVYTGITLNDKKERVFFTGPHYELQQPELSLWGAYPFREGGISLLHDPPGIRREKYFCDR